MTEQELREKIIKLLLYAKKSCNAKKCKKCKYGKENLLHCYESKVADALIAADIGDVSEYKKHRILIPKAVDDGCAFEAGGIKQLYRDEEIEQIVKERDKYKHRAEVAKRALQIADELGELCGRKEDYVQQAEKELQEEKKSD